MTSFHPFFSLAFSLVSRTYRGSHAEASLPAFEACVPHLKQLCGHLSLLGGPVQRCCTLLCSIQDLGSIPGSIGSSLVGLQQRGPGGGSNNHSGGKPGACRALRWQGPAKPIMCNLVWEISSYIKWNILIGDFFIMKIQFSFGIALRKMSIKYVFVFKLIKVREW